MNAVHEDGRARVLVGGPNAIYTYSTQTAGGLTRTALPTGATNQPGYGIGDDFQAMHANAQYFLYVDDNDSLVNPTGGLYRCPIAGCTSAERTLLVPYPIKHLTASAGTAFTSSGPRASASIVSCSVEGCPDGDSVLATGQSHVSDIAADADAVYWTTLGTAMPLANSDVLGRVMRCSLPACAGGPTVVQEGLVNPTSVQLDDRYVYWLTRGAPAVPSGTVSRRRR